MCLGCFYAQLKVDDFCLQKKLCVHSMTSFSQFLRFDTDVLEFYGSNGDKSNIF